MKNSKKIIFDIRIVAFLLAIIIDFLLIKNIVRVHLFGYLFLIVEFLYIIFILYTLLIKNKECRDNMVFNFIQISTYVYKGIAYGQVVALKNYSMTERIMQLYKSNFILLSILLLSIIIYGIMIIRQKNKA